MNKQSATAGRNEAQFARYVAFPCASPARPWPEDNIAW